MITQQDRIVKYMEDFGSITPLEAFQDIGCTRLSAQILNLKRKGYHIGTDIIKTKNRYGNPCHYAQYTLLK